MRSARLLLTGLVGVVLLLGPGLLAAPPAAAAGCGPARAGSVAVMVVIDTGSGGPAQRCVTVPERATGLDALRATGLHLRVGPGGFVCAIGGTPASGCATDDPSLPSWTYWHAVPGGSWTYSLVGAGGYRLPERCAVEGWSFGPPSAKAPPRVAPPSVTCEAPAPPPAAPPPAAAPSPVVPPGSGSAGGGAGGAVRGDANGGGAEPAGELPAGEATATTRPTDDSSPSATAGPGETEVSDEVAGDDAAAGDERDEAGDPERAAAPSESAALQMADPSGADGGRGSWVGTAVVLLVVAAVGGGAVLRSRRR